MFPQHHTIVGPSSFVSVPSILGVNFVLHVVRSDYHLHRATTLTIPTIRSCTLVPLLTKAPCLSPRCPSHYKTSEYSLRGILITGRFEQVSQRQVAMTVVCYDLRPPECASDEMSTYAVAVKVALLSLWLTCAPFRFWPLF